MAITKKTFNQIIKQNTFSGADAGKVLIMDWISLMKKGKRLLNDNEFSKMLDNMNRSPKQIEIYNSYRDFKSFLQQLYSFYQTAYFQYESGRNSLFRHLTIIHQKRQAIFKYLDQPLIISEKEYSKLQADALKDYENKDVLLWALIMFTTAQYIKAYTEKKDIPENIKTLIESYKGKNINVDYESEIDEKKAIEYENKAILQEFSKTYGVENNEQAIKDFILSSPLFQYALTGLENNKTISLIELYERELEKQAKYNNEKFETVIDKAFKDMHKMENEKSYPEQILKSGKTTETIDKLDYLIELAEWLYDDESIKHPIEIYENDVIHKDIWAGFKKYPELLEAVKDMLSSKIKKIGSYTSISSNKKDTIKEKELLKAGLDTLPKDVILEREYFIDTINKEKDNESYIKYEKVFNAGIAVYKGALTTPKKVNDLIKEYADSNYFFNELNTETIKSVYAGKIKESLCLFFGGNTIFDVYSEVFKVDLTPLKLDWNYEDDIFSFNWLLYNQYNYIGCRTSKQTEADRAKLKDVFYPLIKANYQLSPEELEKLKNELLVLPLRETFSSKYTSRFLEGAAVNYDE